jgi:hypothetical protein
MSAQVAQKDVQQSGFITFPDPQAKLVNASEQSFKNV